MKTKLLFLCFALLIVSVACALAQEVTKKNFAVVPAPGSDEKVAIFAGGCFWSMSEAFSELKGVNRVVSGYAGGTKPNPSYEEVGSQTTGHAESVQVYYDPNVVGYDTLVKSFFAAHDPTELNRQGPDEGTDYRSVAFYRTAGEKAAIDANINEINASKHYNDKVVTEVVPFDKFYPAEGYHQGYFKLHPDNPYIQSVSLVKVEKFRREMKAFLKSQR